MLIFAQLIMVHVFCLIYHNLHERESLVVVFQISLKGHSMFCCSFQRVISVFDNLTWSWTLFKNNLPIILLSWNTNYTCTHAHVRRVMYQSKYVFLDLRLSSTQSGRSYPIHTPTVCLGQRESGFKRFNQRVYWTEMACPDKRLKRHHALVAAIKHY